MKKICKRCLIEDLDKDEYIANLMEYVKNYPLEKRATDEVYNNRLSICKTCENLSDGMCSLCGCYVQLRAVKNNMYCPHDDKKW